MGTMEVGEMCRRKKGRGERSGRGRLGFGMLG
jgi:hypothetical protein